MTGTVRSQQREQTRRTLLRAARRLFAEKGYAAVGLAEIVATAGVTKGALYHHFENKSALFAAVLEQIQAEVGERVATAADRHTDPWAQLLAGCDAFLSGCTAPEIQQVMLIDGPAVLGWHTWRAMDAAASARHLREVLELLVSAGSIPRQPIEPLAHLLSGAMNEAALWLAGTDNANALADTTAALHRMLESLRTDI
ncbi:TetR/AcrR family transcriptional regulator [Nocardia brevicatena]|uniref:TetR/AcrR family transcriptional regulator n=1 Tax=Nocardia brevicatena TaxID=37327 RepID=UPI0002E6C6CC|nr:TetR/AcrR family transcriptional regulator [Nocardia brevicatena]